MGQQQYKTYVVRPKISETDMDPVGSALAKHGMSKFAGCPDIIYGAGYDRALDRYLTGLDETHPDILLLPHDERELKQQEILDERIELEKQIGEDLSHTNTKFWETLKIVLDRGMSFSTRNPKDRLILKVIQAGDLAPWGKDNIDDPKYITSNFYIGTEYEDVTEKTETRVRGRKISRQLDDLLEKYDFSIEVGKYLGIEGISAGVPPKNLDDLYSSWLDKKTTNGDAFLEAVSLSEEHIRLGNLFKEFRILGLVEFKDSKWYSGKFKLGKTDKEAVKNLCSNKPEFQAEKATLMEKYNELKEK